MSIRSLPISLPQCDHVPQPYDGPSKDEVLALRRQYLTPGLITYYRDPLLIVEGHMQYLWDERGTRYLDAFAGIVTVSVGHCHPHVVEALHVLINLSCPLLPEIDLNTAFPQNYAKFQEKTSRSPCGVLENASNLADVLGLTDDGFPAQGCS